MQLIFKKKRTRTLVKQLTILGKCLPEVGKFTEQPVKTVWGPSSCISSLFITVPRMQMRPDTYITNL